MFGKKYAALLGTGKGVRAIFSGRVPDGEGWTEITGRQFQRMKKLGLTLVLGRDPRAPTNLVPGIFRFYLLADYLAEMEAVNAGVELWTQAPNLHTVLSKLVDEYEAGVVNDKTLVAAKTVIKRAGEGVAEFSLA